MEARLDVIRTRISAAAEKANRSSEDVKLLAVSKGRSIAAIRELYRLGQRDFGENYAAEMIEKKAALEGDCPSIRWHFLGRIQTNKIHLIAQADCVHSLASARHAQALAKARQGSDVLPVFLQVDFSGETQRFGIRPNELETAWRQISLLPQLRIEGLMVLLPLSGDRSPAEWFAKLAGLRDQLARQVGAKLPELSMGMSGDFEDAILRGATWVRIGTALFTLN